MLLRIFLALAISAMSCGVNATVERHDNTEPERATGFLLRGPLGNQISWRIQSDSAEFWAADYLSSQIIAKELLEFLSKLTSDVISERFKETVVKLENLKFTSWGALIMVAVGAIGENLKEVRLINCEANHDQQVICSERHESKSQSVGLVNFIGDFMDLSAERDFDIDYPNLNHIVLDVKINGNEAHFHEQILMGLYQTKRQLTLQLPRLILNSAQYTPEYFKENFAKTRVPKTLITKNMTVKYDGNDVIVSNSDAVV
jgi:hypothetical protein